MDALWQHSINQKSLTGYGLSVLPMGVAFSPVIGRFASLIYILLSCVSNDLLILVY